jgi:hypothetical protein
MTMVSKELQLVHALRNAQVSAPKRSACERMATAGNGTAGRNLIKASIVWMTAKNGNCGQWHGRAEPPSRETIWTV